VRAESHQGDGCDQSVDESLFHEHCDLSFW
jgi:hypothetical protein